MGETGIWCDVREFERALVEGRAGEGLALYRGDLLPGLFISDAPDFEHWLADVRSRLRTRAVEAAWTLGGEVVLPALRGDLVGDPRVLPRLRCSPRR